MKALYTLIVILMAGFAYGESQLPTCQGSKVSQWLNCFGNLIDASGDKYLGEFENGTFNGKGAYFYANGDEYVGEFKDGNKNGQGIFFFANDDKYEGEYKDDKKNGRGTYYYLAKDQFKGDKYVGEYKDGKKNGQGTYYFLADNQFKGNKYVGEFKDGEFNGQGTYFYANGDVYVGEFKDGMKNGQDIFKRTDKLIERSEIFKEDKLATSQDADPNSVTRIAQNSVNPPASNNSIVEKEQLGTAYGQSKLPECSFLSNFFSQKHNCYDSVKRINDREGWKYIYEGEWKNDEWEGEGTYTEYRIDSVYDSGYERFKYKGKFKNGKYHGQGTYSNKEGGSYKLEGVWANGELVQCDKVDIPQHYTLEGEFSKCNHLIQNNLRQAFIEQQNLKNGKIKNDNVNNQDINTAYISERIDLERERKILAEEKRKIEADKTTRDQEARQVAEEKRKLDAQKAQIEQEKKASRIAIKGSASQPDANGDFTFTIQTGADTASLKIDGEEVGGKRDGNYVIKRVARVGKENSYKITARDIFGNTDSVTITVARQVADSRPEIPRLNPANVKVQQSRDAVAIIIGIENYRRVAKADFANADANEFYTYASRALGIKPENIKLLVDDGADDIEMLNAFQNWLPLKVNKGKTDVYVFYSGHGYPSQDGSSLYFLPFNVDKQYLDRTSVKQKEVVAALQKVQAKSVTMFIDACYSGQSRNGEPLVAGLKPIALKAEEMAYPPEFTVITASAANQFSSASQDLKHGIFSFYLMKGLEGDADLNKDGKITSGELQQYLSEMVVRQAMGLNRTQNTQLFGDAARVLVGR